MKKYFLILFSSMTLISCSQKRQPVKLIAVEKKTLKQTALLDGALHPNRQTIIYPAFPGYIQKIFVDVGQKVKAGHSLVSISESTLRDPAHPLAAPFNGTVVHVAIKEGEYVTPTNPAGGLIKIDDLSHMYFETQANERDIYFLTAGQIADIEIFAISQKKYSGTVKRISLSSKTSADWFDRGKVQFPIEIEINDSDTTMKTGMTGKATILIGEYPNALVLPYSCIYYDQNKPYVMLKNNKKQPVELGAYNETHIQIVAGLTEGDQVQEVDFLALE
jgi:macrolide-specific efflux system membrane fusion protein